jgi:hypothetical protein
MTNLSSFSARLCAAAPAGLGLLSVVLLGACSSPGGPGTSPTAYVLISTNTFSPGSKIAVVEVVNLDTFQPVRNLNLGAREIGTMAVDTANKHLFVNGGTSNDVMVFASDTGAFVQEFSTLTGAQKIVMSPDATAVYVESSVGLTKIDAATLAILGTVPSVSGDEAVDAALSANGKQAARLVYSGSSSSVELIDLTTFAETSRAKLTTSTGCVAYGSHIAFGPAGRVLVSDEGCAVLEQFDANVGVELPLEVALGASSAAGADTFLTFAAATGKVLESKESLSGSTTGDGGFAVIDPANLTFKLVGGFVDGAEPSAAAIDLADSNSAWMAAGGRGLTAAQLYKFDLSTGQLAAPSSYTFATTGAPVRSITLTEE